MAAAGMLAAALAWTGPTLQTLPAATLLYTGYLAVVLVLVFRHGPALDDPWVLLGGALLLRLLFLPSVTDLSVDPFRYVWDGWLTVEGTNPYRWVPSDPELVHRHGTELFREMNSRDFFSIYPPLSQWLFIPAGIAYERLGWPGALFVLKGTLALVELGGVVLLFKALRLMGMAPRWLALYAWNPLALVAVAAVGHSEGGLVLGLGILAFGLARGSPRTAWAGLGLAVISKAVPLLVAPLLFRHHRIRTGAAAALRAAAVGAVPALLLSAPFFFAGLPARVAASADLYVRLFEFNAGPYALLRSMLDPLVSWNVGAVLGPGLRGLMLAAAAAIWWVHPVSRARDVLRGGLLLMGIYLAAATTVHPWYLLWGLALVPFTRRHRGAWLWASWAAFPTYFAYTGTGEGWLAALFWGGVMVALIWEEGPRLRNSLLRVAGRRKARQIEPWLAGERILDLGSGEGYVGAHLEALAGDGNRRVILADVDPFFQERLPRFLFDGLRLPLESDSVDTVVLSLVLHHAGDPGRLLEEAFRVARRRVVITESTYRYGWERGVLEVADRLVNRGRGSGAMGTGRGILHFRTVVEWKREIEIRGGLVLVSRRLNRVGHRHHLLVARPP